MDLYVFLKSNKIFSISQVAQDTQLATHVQQNLIRLGLLAPPADGKVGPLTTAAIEEMRSRLKVSEPALGPLLAKALIQCKELPMPELHLGNDLASRIIKYMLHYNYNVDFEQKHYNLVYVEGMSEDGSLNDNAPDTWSAQRLLIEIIRGVPKIVFSQAATTRPGIYWDSQGGMEGNGAAFLTIRQHTKAWSVGLHDGNPDHPALVQTGEVEIIRDAKEIFQRSGYPRESGLYGINNHHGWNSETVYNTSAGCLVGQSIDLHLQFMGLIKQDARYIADNDYQFSATLIYGPDLVKQSPT